MTPLERRYRRLLLAYPRAYRAAHGQELLGVLLDCADPGRTAPDVREAAGLLAGGVRERLRHAARGVPWRDGLHLGLTAVMVTQLAVLLPYARDIPVWVALSALALLAALRGRVGLALPPALLTGLKAIAVASGLQPFDVTLLPVYPGFLTSDPLFVTRGPGSLAMEYGLTCCGLLVLAVGGGGSRARSWWWAAAVPLAAWAGPVWPAVGRPAPVGLGRMALELGVLCLAVWAARLARDPRWALAAAVYLLAVTARLGEHLTTLTSRHLAYWGLLALLTAATAVISYDRRRGPVLD
ncbi:hypothetical protein [Sphaerisporangium fuscum]|uniref:hypothetical protein n=1 Tax=Sphaerisporangium fuscum TaxID=2835868 RepID=UPI001BDC7502|nr:hypothetical protein [Sphaerisporangium fuscum]